MNFINSKPRNHKRSDESMMLLLAIFRRHLPHHQESSPLKTLWFADENALAYAPELNTLSCQFISNRWDVYQALKISGCQFSDYQWPENTKADSVYCRIPKEKPVVLHLLNQVKQHLSPIGQAFFTGGKQEGIKSIHSQAKKIFGNCSLEKHGKSYSLTLSQPLHSKTEGDKTESSIKEVNSQSYPELRTIGDFYGQALFSKPGVFGWKKMDAGTAFLLDVLDQEKAKWSTETFRCLDLGCGYGLLTIALGHWGFGQNNNNNNEYCGFLAASDNNAAAIHAIQKNIHERQLQATIWADDCAGQLLSEPSRAPNFDVIVCNPPFHQGFDTDTSLTDHFLKNTQQLLSSRGAAYFVVNTFIGLEKRAQHFFSKVTTLANNGKFKVIQLMR